MSTGLFAMNTDTTYRIDVVHLTSQKFSPTLSKLKDFVGRWRLSCLIAFTE